MRGQSFRSVLVLLQPKAWTFGNIRELLVLSFKPRLGPKAIIFNKCAGAKRKLLGRCHVQFQDSPLAPSGPARAQRKRRKVFSRLYLITVKHTQWLVVWYIHCKVHNFNLNPSTVLYSTVSTTAQIAQKANNLVITINCKGPDCDYNCVALWWLMVHPIPCLLDRRNIFSNSKHQSKINEKYKVSLKDVVL